MLCCEATPPTITLLFAAGRRVHQPTKSAQLLFGITNLDVAQGSPKNCGLPDGVSEFNPNCKVKSGHYSGESK